jgi:flagellar FliL protein
MAKTAKEAKSAGKDEESKKGGKKKLVIFMLPLVLLGAGAAYYFLMGTSPSKSKAAAALPPVVYNFGPITTNLNDGHVVQAQMTFQFKGGTVITPISTQEAQIMNDVIETFSSWSYNALLPANGKAAFASQLMSTLNTLFKKDPGKPQIQQIYFTNFIMQ